MASLLSRRQKHFVLAYFVEKQAGTKLPIFDRKPWTNPFGKIKMFDFFKSMLI